VSALYWSAEGPSGLDTLALIELELKGSAQHVRQEITEFLKDPVVNRAASVSVDAVKAAAGAEAFVALVGMSNASMIATAVHPVLGAVAVGGLGALAIHEMMEASHDASGALLKAVGERDAWADNGGNLVESATLSLGWNASTAERAGSIPGIVSDTVVKDQIGIIAKMVLALPDLIDAIQRVDEKKGDEALYEDFQKVDFSIHPINKL
jgi:hypothetical protein